MAYLPALQYADFGHLSFTAAPSPLYHHCHWKHLQLSTSCPCLLICRASHTWTKIETWTETWTEGNRWSSQVQNWQIVLAIFCSFFGSLLSKQRNRHFCKWLSQGCSKFYGGGGTRQLCPPTWPPRTRNSSTVIICAPWTEVLWHFY